MGFFRYMAIGGYVGWATVAAAAYWFMYDAEGPGVTYHQLSHFMQCHDANEDFTGIECEIFEAEAPMGQLLAACCHVPVLLPALHDHLCGSPAHGLPSDSLEPGSVASCPAAFVPCHPY